MGVEEGNEFRVAGFVVRASLAVLLAIGLLETTVLAQRSGVVPPALEDAGIEERLGEKIPLDLAFTNTLGQNVQLSQYFDGETPVLLALVYHECPMLCSLVLHGLTASLKGMEWTPGENFRVLTVSFNARETFEVAARARDRHLAMLGKPAAAAGWHFLTGSDPSIEALTGAVGFHYNWVEAQQEFAHPSGLIFLDGNGKISRYLNGVEYKPRDVRTALVEASQGKVGSPLDQIILYCFQYDANANSYVPHAINLMKAGGILTILVLGSVLLMFWRREGRIAEAA